MHARRVGQYRAGLNVVFALVMLFGIAPGLLASSAAEDTREKILRIHQVLYPENADPQRASFSQEIAFLVTNYEGLTRLDENGETSPAAAESWEFNEDGTVVTFHLRDNLMYSDGSPLTADRFVYSVQRACDPNVAGDYQYILFEIVGCAEFASLYAEADGATPVSPDDTDAYDAAREAVGIEAPDDQTVVVTLNQPAPYFPSIAGLWVFFPVQQELVDAAGEGWWTDPANHLGNGPFQVTQMEQDQLIAFEANENYWGGRPLLDGIELVYVPDAAVALEAYNAGDLDIVNVDPAQLPAIQSDPVLSEEFLSYPTASTMGLALNLAMAPFDDTKVREAFAYAFDRQTWCTDVMNGSCLPTQGWIPQGVPGSMETDAFAFDPDAAVQALADSSYGGPEGLPPIEYHYIADIPEERPRSEWIAGQYRDVLGVEITLVPVEQATWVQSVGDPELFPQMTGLGWIQDYPDPQNWLSIWTCGSIFAGPAGYCNPAFDELVNQANQDLNAETRFPAYEEAHQIFLDDVPMVITHNLSVDFLVKPEVSGYAMTPSDVEWPGAMSSPLTLDVSRD